jgi:hypothetical protein
MIQLFDTETGVEHKFEITKFPDNTSQCWRITPEPQVHRVMTVRWMFENEAELFHVCQLGMLLSIKYKIFPTLWTPFLPFARQDKSIANDATFARAAFIRLVIESGYTRIRAYDAHSPSSYVESKAPTELIEVALPGHDVVCFPDAGAVQRYKHLIPLEYPMIYCDKVRNQQTGEITGLELVSDIDISGKRVLIQDDLCDGGRTFIEATRVLKEAGAKDISLAVSHGIFSKGMEILLDAGINTVYTTNSLLKNSVGNSCKYMFFSGVRDFNLNVIEVVK